jgi:hypothetical protein
MMTRLLPMIVLVLFGAGMLQAQTAETRDSGTHCSYLKLAACPALQSAIQNYRAALQSDNPGVVESAMYYTVLLRARHPREDCRCLLRALTRLTDQGATPAIRYKAALALHAFENPDLIPGDDNPAWQSIDEFFVLLSRRLETRLLAQGHS